jgi:hypothetical protein
MLQMNLITFDKTSKKPAIRNSIPFITVNSRGKFNFSQGARRLLSLTDGDRVLLHQDEKYRSDWYLQITREERGYKIVMGNTDSRFTCSRAGKEIFKSIGRKEDKMSFQIEKKPYASNDMILFSINTKNPIN